MFKTSRCLWLCQILPYLGMCHPLLLLLLRWEKRWTEQKTKCKEEEIGDLAVNFSTILSLPLWFSLLFPGQGAGRGGALEGSGWAEVSFSCQSAAQDTHHKDRLIDKLTLHMQAELHMELAYASSPFLFPLGVIGENWKLPFVVWNNCCFRRIWESIDDTNHKWKL